MKKSLLTILALTLSSTTFAATSGNLNLKGVVAESLSILVTGEPNHMSLDLHDQNVSDLKVATVLEKSNSKTGYKVSVSSLNKGVLAHEDGEGVDSLAYTMKYGNKSIDLSKVDEMSQVQADAYSVSNDVQISYNGRAASDMVAGEYTDTVTFSISAN